MQFNKGFYEKHGIKVTEEPINRNKNPEQTRLEQALLDAVKNKPVNFVTVKSVEQAVEKYPDSEALKNYLYIAYSRTNQFEKALDCLFNTIKNTPIMPLALSIWSITIFIEKIWLQLLNG